MKKKIFFTIFLIIFTTIINISKGSHLNLNCSNNFVSDDGFFNKYLFGSSKVKDIKDLKFTDIKVVASIGDSLTAGFGINGVIGGLQEYVGNNWATGFNDNVYSLANFIQHYSPDLVGGSVGKHYISIADKCNYSPGHIEHLDHFNAAQSTARACNGKIQAEWLIERMKENSQSYNKDWKFISVLLGFNDVCNYCKTKNYLENFTNGYRELLTELYKIPNVYVNVLQLFEGKEILIYKKKDSYCRGVNFITGRFECVCLNDIVKTQNYNKLQSMFDDVNSIMQELVDEFNSLAVSENRHDWYAKTIKVSIKFNIHDFSEIDCFHLSFHGQKKLAIAAWNKLTYNINDHNSFYCLNNKSLKLIK